MSINVSSIHESGHIGKWKTPSEEIFKVHFDRMMFPVPFGNAGI